MLSVYSKTTVTLNMCKLPHVLLELEHHNTHHYKYCTRKIFFTEYCLTWWEAYWETADLVTFTKEILN